MTDPQNNSDAYDSPWKEVLEHAFPEFMAFYSLITVQKTSTTFYHENQLE